MGDTELKQKIQEFEESGIFLEAILDAFPGNVALVNQRSRIAMVNQAWIDFGEANGLAREYEWIGVNYLEVCQNAQEENSEGANQVCDQIYAILSGQQSYFELEYPCHSPEEERWFQMRASPIKLAGHNWAVTAHFDITERKKAEQELRESEETHRLTLSNISDAVFITDASGALTFICPNVHVIFGYSHSEVEELGNITGLLEDGLFDPDELETSGEITNIEQKILDKAGREHDLLVNVKRISLKGGTILYTCHDITDRKRAEEAQWGNQSRLANILETAMDAIITVNEDQLLVMLNPAAKQMFGLEGKDIVGRPLNELLPERFRKKHTDHIRTFGQTNVTSRSMGDLAPLMGRRANGEEFPIEVSISQAKLSNEKLYTAIIRDITERKKAEQTLQERVKELNCLYSMSELVERSGVSLKEIHQRTVELVLAAWQYPEITCARIVLKDQEFRTENFAVTPWQQTADIIVFGERTGTLEVYYLEERPESEEGVFLSGERSLIKEISERLGRTIERINVEETLQASEEKYHDLVENIGDVIYATDSEGKITYVSPTIESLLGYKPADILGQSFVQFIAPSDAEWGKDNFQKFALGKSLDPSEYQVQTKSGEIGWIRVSSQPILEEDQVIGVQGVITEITHQKHAEEALRTSESLLRTVAENYPAFLSIILKGEQDLIVDFTTGKEFKRLNLDPESFVGKTLEEVFGDQTSIVRENYLRAFMGEDVSFELFINDQNQLYNAIPLIDKNGVIDRILVVVENIDDRKLVEAQIQELAKFEERNRIARELHDSVTQSLYSINLQSDATAMALSSGRTEDALRRLQTLKGIAQESMTEMRLLIYELHPSVLEEVGLVAALRQRLETVEARSGIEVELQIEGEQRLPIAVEEELFHISLEGLNNVLKHAKAKQVLVRLSFEHDRCRLMIQDDGVGFDLELSDRFGGYGLANIKHRLEQIGGELTIITEPGKGTTLDIEVAI